MTHFRDYEMPDRPKIHRAEMQAIFDGSAQPNVTKIQYWRGENARPYTKETQAQSKKYS